MTASLSLGRFANAYGGAVLLGIRESKEKPPVAAKIVPIQRCADLTERLKLVFRDRVEPQLPRIDILAVRTEGESGVVIIRVGRSRLAPHRVTRTLVCPVRRSDRCEEMSMREIQDMTLNVSRGLERLERRLLERALHERNLTPLFTTTSLVNKAQFDQPVTVKLTIAVFAVRNYSGGEKPHPFPLAPDLPVNLFANLAVWADRVKKQAHAQRRNMLLKLK